MDTATAQPKTRRRRWRVVVLTVTLLILAAIAVPGWLVRSTPAYWRPVDVADPQVTARAEEVESRIATQTTSVRPADESWTLELTEEQVNAWLATRLRQWLANQGVDQEARDLVPHAMMNFADQRIELAAELKLKGISQVVRLRYRPQAVTDEPSRLKLESVYAGRMRIPLEMIVEQVRARIGGADAEDAAEVIAALRSIELVLPLDDGRTVTVTDVQVSPGRAVLTCRTQLPQRPPRQRLAPLDRRGETS
jgi:uncharacterized protein YpmS